MKIELTSPKLWHFRTIPRGWSFRARQQRQPCFIRQPFCQLALAFISVFRQWRFAHPPSATPEVVVASACRSVRSELDPSAAVCPFTSSNSQSCRCQCLPFDPFGIQPVGGGLPIHPQQLQRLSLQVFAVCFDIQSAPVRSHLRDRR